MTRSGCEHHAGEKSVANHCPGSEAASPDLIRCMARSTHLTPELAQGTCGFARHQIRADDARSEDREYPDELAGDGEVGVYVGTRDGGGERGGTVDEGVEDAEGVVVEV